MCERSRARVTTHGTNGRQRRLGDADDAAAAAADDDGDDDDMAERAPNAAIRTIEISGAQRQRRRRRLAERSPRLGINFDAVLGARRAVAQTV